MKRTTKLILLLLIILLISIVIGLIFLHITNSKEYGENISIEDDYYALITYEPSSKYGENIYFYIDGYNDSRIIKTKWHTESWTSTKVEETIIEEKSIGHNENIYTIVKQNYNDSYSIILNRDIPETKYRKGYSKGDKITLDELVSLVALN